MMEIGHLLLTIENPATKALVVELAMRRGVSEQEAVRQAVAAELERSKRSLVEALAEFHRENPLPPMNGPRADKAFYDDLSGDP